MPTRCFNEFIDYFHRENKLKKNCYGTRNVFIYNHIISYHVLIISYRACLLFYHALILSGLTFNFNSFPFILSCWSFCAFLLASNFFSKHKSFKAPYTKRYRTRNVKSYPAFYLYTNLLVLKSNSCKSYSIRHEKVM